MPDCWTINPYRGCSFGCRYCYARYTHEFLGIADPEAFDRQIFVKMGAADSLEREGTPRKLRARPIAIGTVTDPYQPAEAGYKLTRSLLEVLSAYRGLRVSITTKSALVLRDLDLLGKLNERSSLSIHVSLITLRRGLARQLDPGAPTPARRLRMVRTLADAGLFVGVNAMPVLPFLTDPVKDLEQLFASARDHGAHWVIAAPLFLPSASRRPFFAWLRNRKPHLLPLYRRLYSGGIDVDPEFRRALRKRIQLVRARTGVLPGPDRGWAQEPTSVQLPLPGLMAPPERRRSPTAAAAR
jgi:DNA repair photolyase